ncbi:hypothetical protein QCN29_19630 [Streptomyces sp. HNM0663]|uniref:Uncharacterized protein n=1 Tax=Streptomyces chengmaiensis TaxID=3040919 RepID=A0ABT6HRL6_9ACTN|nr:hypothetical protein [Streptomyces chengmaiensis]MDH2390961.1 hypothetical protein [Streptomyces chengmaiensis]
MHDLLWAHAEPADRVEHIRVRPHEAGMEAIVFLRADSDAAALSGVRELLARVREPVGAHGYVPMMAAD